MNDKAAGFVGERHDRNKVRDRFDVQPVDDGAIIKGNITEVVQGIRNAAGREHRPVIESR